MAADLPEAAAVFDAATALDDTAMDLVAPQPALVERLVHLHRSFYPIEAPVIYSGYETTTLYPTLD